jgi:hypothetical protein
MSVNGEERDHRRGELLTASGETKVAVDTPRRMRRAGTDLRRFPCSLIDHSAEEAPNLAPATSPRLPRSTSPQPPFTQPDSLGEFPAPTTGK